MTITVYSKESCVQCSATYRMMDRNEIDHTIAHVNEMPADVKDLNYRQAPIVVVRDGEEILDSWFGFNPDKIETYA